MSAKGGDPYAGADRCCDVVMKGGITSGVVYPKALCELAKTYRYKSVGGTSAGAIAAAATAAAEYGREAGKSEGCENGFPRLAKLGDELGEAGKVKSLFQPQDSTKPLFRVLIGNLDGGRWGAARAALLAAPLVAILGAAPGAVLLVLSFLRGLEKGFDWLVIFACIASALLLVLGLAVAVVFRLARIAVRNVPDNGFGICSGAAAGSGEEALTPWLTKVLNQAAGLPCGDPQAEQDPQAKLEPLTFGHLWAGPKGDRENPSEAGKRFLELEMMTTNLVNRVAQRVPWDDGHWYFDPAEFRQLFPEEVVSWMEERPRPLSENPRRSELHRAMMWPRRPLPAARDLPVVVAARFSLSFPVLLSAVPLWRFDFDRPVNADREREWDGWRHGSGAGWRLPEDEAERPGLPPDGTPKSLKAEQCWFSDGGISSNFPIHFFDRVLPTRPTFAINLRPFRLEEEPDGRDQSKNVAMVKTNRDEIKDWWYRLPERKRRVVIKDDRLPKFLMAAVKTMQNRVDEAQMRAPGFRDRVAHVKLSDKEGGMNLTMPADRVKDLVKRGEEAAKLLHDAYTAPVDSGKEITWDNHRWVRLRTALAAFEQMHGEFTEGFDAKREGGDDAQSYAELLARGSGEPTSYDLEPGQQKRGEAEVAEIRRFRNEATGEDALSNGNVPKPRPVGRIVPRI